VRKSEIDVSDLDGGFRRHQKSVSALAPTGETSIANPRQSVIRRVKPFKRLCTTAAAIEYHARHPGKANFR